MQSLVCERTRAASLAALFFLYPVLLLNLSGMPYFETIHRITAMQTFNASVFGSSNNDSVAILVLFFIFFVFSTRSRSCMAMCIFATAAVILLSIFFPSYFEPVRLAAAAATLPLLISLLAFSWIVSRRPHLIKGMISRVPIGSLTIDMKKVGIYYAVIIISLEALALARWVLYPLYPAEIYGDASWAAVKIEASLFHTFALLSPFAITLVAFSFLYRNFISMLLEKVFHPIKVQPEGFIITNPPTASGSAGKPKPQETSIQQQKTTPPPKPQHLSGIISKKMGHRYSLLAAVVVSVLLVAYPHLPGINPDQHGVSTDEQYYLSWVTHLRSGANGDPVQLLHNAFVINNGDRPLTLLLLISLSNLTGLHDLTIIRFIPLLLAPALVVACYVFVRSSFRANSTFNPASATAASTMTAAQNKWMAIIVGFTTVFSPQIVVGMYAGLLANWLAIIAGFVALLFLTRLWENSASRLSTMLLNASCLAGMMTLIMLFHAYSFWYFSVVFGVFALVSFLYTRNQAGKTILKSCIILMALTPGILLDFSKPLFSDISPGLETQGAMVQKQFSLSNFNVRLENLSETVQTYVGGYLAAPLIWLLVLAWILKSRSATSLDRLILSMLFITAIPLLFGSVEFQTRIIYNTPMQIPAALVLLNHKNDNALNPGTTERRLVMLAALFIFANYAISAMANLYLVLPDGYGTSTPILLP